MDNQCWPSVSRTVAPDLIRGSAFGPTGFQQTSRAMSGPKEELSTQRYHRRGRRFQTGRAVAKRDPGSSPGRRCLPREQAR